MITRIGLLVCMAHATGYGRETRQKLEVCLKVETTDPHFIIPRARELATRIFAGIAIPLEWRACKPAAESSQTPIVVRLISRMPEGFRSGSLGCATPYGRHITIFFDRIETMQDPSAVLGHVMVHEITHIIQGVSRHSHTGLMKPHWNNHDLVQMRYKPLPFTEEDLLLLYAGLAMRRESTDTQTVGK